MVSGSGTRRCACGTPRPESVSGHTVVTSVAHLGWCPDLDKTVRLWTPRPESGRTLEGHPWVTSVALSADGSRVVSESDDNTVRLWNTATGECLGPWRAHQGASVG